MQNTRNVTDSIVWVGANDRRIALFELEKFNQYKTIYLIISLLILIILI